MIRFILVATFVILFLILSIPLLLIEWIIGKFNMDLKDRSSQKIVNWAFRVCLFLAGTSVTVIGQERYRPTEPCSTSETTEAILIFCSPACAPHVRQAMLPK